MVARRLGSRASGCGLEALQFARLTITVRDPEASLCLIAHQSDRLAA
jgi:hypothetical protein